jgi:dihydroorotate dehydrogenase electron transfer subunit
VTTRPLQVLSEVVSLEPIGEYWHLVLAAPTIAAQVRPGHFVALAVGGPHTSMLLRRSFSVYRAADGRVEIVFSVAGKGTQWLAGLRPGDRIDVVGPVGQPFRLPTPGSTAVLVAGGYGSAPMFGLADAIRATGGAAHFVLGAATAGRLFGVDEAQAGAGQVLVTTDDGSLGTRGRVTDVLGDLITATGATTVFACGPMPMLRAVARMAGAAGVASQCAVEEAMACGIGVCMTCVLPVRGADGQTRMVRACTDGPVFDGTAVRWDEVGTIPPDTVGAPHDAAALAAAAATEQVGDELVEEASAS